MKRRQYSDEFKSEAVRMAENGEIPMSQVASNLGINAEMLRRWVRQFGTKPNVDGARNLKPDEHSELIRLRRELKRVTEERDILKKAMGIFTRELP
ncbi:MAG TPA: transposase [Armatimonadota bacterium]|nr:transposase [Armatimonadota bacterium]HPP76201.1 transposase [Armatimonadota bacterium]